MRLSHLLIGAAAAALSFGAAANAATAFDANLANPGVYYGSGNVNGGFTTETANGIEIGLRAKPYQGSPIDSATNVYNIALGTIASLDYSYNPDLNNTLSSFVGVPLLTILNVGTGQTASYIPSLPAFGNATNAGAVGGYQNSERLDFGFLNGGSILGNIGYNVNTDATYKVTFGLTGESGSMMDTIFIQQGAGAAVPEPATWGLMIVGIGAMGLMLRHKRQQAGTLA